jgi:hypothetical protein
MSDDRRRLSTQEYIDQACMLDLTNLLARRNPNIKLPIIVERQLIPALWPPLF